MPKAKPVHPTKPVPERALLRRVNRKLAETDEVVYRSRAVQGQDGPVYDHNTGRFYQVNTGRNFIVSTHVDLEALGRDLAVLKPWEALMEEE